MTSKFLNYIDLSDSQSFLNNKGRELSNVFKKKKPKLANELRRLKCQVSSKRHYLPLATRLNTLDLFKSSSMSKVHRTVLVNAIELQIHIFSGGQYSTAQPPLWVKLLLTGSGLRQLSEPWISSAQNLLLRTGLEVPSDFVRKHVQSPLMAYRLGHPEMATQLLKPETSFLFEELLLRIKAAKDFHLYEIDEQILQSSISEDDKVRIINILLVKCPVPGTRRQFRPTYWTTPDLMCVS